jgi:hypothetical protein
MTTDAKTTTRRERQEAELTLALAELATANAEVAVRRSEWGLARETRDRLER